MGIDGVTEGSTAPADEVHGGNAKVAEARRVAMSTALKMRNDGASRSSVVSFLTEAEFPEATANVMVDQFDEQNAFVHGKRAADMSDRAVAKVEEMESKLPPQQESRQQEQQPHLTKDPQVLLNEATQMADGHASKAEIVKHLTEHGVSAGEAGKAASSVTMVASAARAQAGKSRNDAYWKIGIGLCMLVVGLILMAGGGESSGRRTPLGACVGGAIMLVSGLTALVRTP